MGSAIIKGVAESGLADIRLYAYDPDAGKLAKLAECGVTPCSSDFELAGICQYILLAVKPNQLDEALSGIKDAVTDETVLISICAGISEEYIAARTVANAKIVLVMPNTPLLLGEGASALARGRFVGEAEFEVVRSVFSSCGVTAVIDIGKMKEVTAINGSSPAFIYLFAKALSDYGLSVGIDPEAVSLLIAQTLRGSAKMFAESGLPPERLIDMVASKGGTTEAALSRLYEGGFEDLVKNACDACTKRAYALSGK
jgi:pyrroline-5-carboxylate reductase